MLFQVLAEHPVCNPCLPHSDFDRCHRVCCGRCTGDGGTGRSASFGAHVSQYFCSRMSSTVSNAGLVHVFFGRVSIFGPTIAVVSGVSFFPLILTFIFAVYATGYIREVIKGHILTTCLGYSCSVFVSYFPIPLVFSVSFCYLFLFSSSPSFSYSSLLWCGCWFVLLWPLSSLSTWRSVWHVNRFWRDLD